jgi:hypothetical protein
MNAGVSSGKCIEQAKMARAAGFIEDAALVDLNHQALVDKPRPNTNGIAESRTLDH